jgi:hypothetical protein
MLAGVVKSVRPIPKAQLGAILLPMTRVARAAETVVAAVAAAVAVAAVASAKMDTARQRARAVKTCIDRVRKNLHCLLALMILPACVALAGAAHAPLISPIGRWAESVRPAAMIDAPDGFALLLVKSPHIGRSAMLLQIFDNDGKVRSEHRLFDDPLPSLDPRIPEAVREARFYSMRSAIVAQPGGGFLVAAAEYEIGRSTVWVQRASGDGSPDGEPVRIADMRDARGASVRLVQLRDGAVLLWISPDEGDHERLFACAIDPDGHPIGEIHELLSALHHDSIAFANPEFDVAATSDHTFALVWAEDSRRSVDIIEQEFNADGVPANRRMQIAGGGSTTAAKPLLLPASRGLAVVWRETVGKATTTLRGAILDSDRRLSQVVDVATERFIDVALAGSDDNLLLATLEADRAGVALKLRPLATDLCPLGEPYVETVGAIDTGSMRSTGSSSNAALVWSQREESEHTLVSLGVLRASQ